MGNGLIFSRVLRVFNDVFDNQDTEITEKTTSKDLLDWDSVAQVKLALSLESEFGIRFTTDEVSVLRSVQGFHDAVAAHLGRKGA